MIFRLLYSCHSCLLSIQHYSIFYGTIDRFCRNFQCCNGMDGILSFEPVLRSQHHKFSLGYVKRFALCKVAFSACLKKGLIFRNMFLCNAAIQSVHTLLSLTLWTVLGDTWGYFCLLLGVRQDGSSLSTVNRTCFGAYEAEHIWIHLRSVRAKRKYRRLPSSPHYLALATVSCKNQTTISISFLQTWPFPGCVPWSESREFHFTNFIALKTVSLKDTLHGYAMTFRHPLVHEIPKELLQFEWTWIPIGIHQLLRTLHEVSQSFVQKERPCWRQPSPRRGAGMSVVIRSQIWSTEIQAF